VGDEGVLLVIEGGFATVCGEAVATVANGVLAGPWVASGVIQTIFDFLLYVLRDAAN